MHPVFFQGVPSLDYVTRRAECLEDTHGGVLGGSMNFPG